MKTPPQFSTPEFKRLQAEWDRKLADSGFDDIERPPPCRATGDPSRYGVYHGTYHRDYIRSDNPAGRNVSLSIIEDIEEGSNGQESPVSDVCLWDSPVDYLEEALFHGFPFRSRKDRAIARRLHLGQSWQHIEDALHVGQSRIERVIREIKSWLAAR